MDKTLLLLIISLIGMGGAIALVIFGLLWKPTNKPPAANVPVTSLESRLAAGATSLGSYGQALLAQLSNLRSSLSATHRAGFNEALRVLRDPLTGKLLIVINGQQYAHFTELPEARLREGVITIVQELVTFVGREAPTSTPAPSMSPVTPPPAIPPTTKNTVTATPAVPATASQPTIRRPSMNPFEQMRLLREVAQNMPPPPKPMIEQIDEFIQLKIATSSYCERRIHLRANQSGAAVFEIDGRPYASIEEIPEVGVRELISTAIQEWEARQ